MLLHRAEEKAAMVFTDLASALDAGLTLEHLGGDAALDDHALADLCERRAVTLRPPERIVLAAAWKSGNASACLRKRAAARQRRAQFLTATQSALAYPTLLFALLFVAALATMTFIGPLVAVVISLVYAAICAGSVALARKLGRGDSSLERLPIVGGVVLEMRELPYLETLHALYSAGVPIVDAHRTAHPTVRMQGLREQLVIAQRLLEEGRSLQEALATSSALSLETRTLLATGEQSGDLEGALERALQRRSEMATRRLASAARTISAVAYGVAAAGVFAIAVLFYTKFYAPLFAVMR